MIDKALLIQWECLKCGKKWFPRKSSPTFCPNPTCHSIRIRSTEDSGDIIETETIALAESRVPLTIYITKINRRKMKQWKRDNPNLHWDALLEGSLKNVRLHNNRIEELIESKEEQLQATVSPSSETL